jgi:site-specific recombinase XerD
MKPEWLSEFLAAQRLRAGALGDQIGMFGKSLVDRGYAPSTMREQVRLVAGLGRWLEQHHLSASEVDEARTVQFLAHRRRRGRKARSNAATLSALLEVLRDLEVIGRPPMVDADLDVSPIARVECEFARYLVEERGLSAATRANYVPVVRRLLSRRFNTGPIKLADLRPEDVIHFVVHEARTMSPGRMKVIVPGLRAFLRWSHQCGETKTALVGCVPRVADWRLTTLPKSIAPDQVERMLRHCDRTTATGRRDYAILLLLARLGLRAGEVVAMELDDLDWEVGALVVRGKGGRHDRLPLPRDVGAAVVAYLRHGRPDCSTRRVFIRARAPRQGFANSIAICTIVERALDRAGLQPPRKGAHLLRHALACTMLRRGASLAEIGEVLRHRSPDTTAIYAKVDVATLRALAPAWPQPAGDA